MISNTLFSLLSLALLLAPTSVLGYWVEQSGKAIVHQRLDPLLFPNSVSPHVHVFLGSNAIAPSMSWDSLRSAVSTAQPGVPFTKEGMCTTEGLWIDGSATWSPALYERKPDGTFSSFELGFGRLYHFNRIGNKERAKGVKNALAFPKGLRMLAGDGMRFSNDTPTKDPPKTVQFTCLNYKGGSSTTPLLPEQACPDGLRLEVTFPSCWDGVNLDSKDHKSHMAYPSGLDNGDCPDSHPVRLATKFDEWVFSTGEQDNAGHKRLVIANGDMLGLSFHADYIAGWDVQAMQMALEQCEYSNHPDNNDLKFLDARLGLCPALASHLAKPLAKPDSLPGTDNCTAPSLVQGERVLGDGLKWLPGCNPVRNGPFKQTDADMAGCLDSIKDVTLAGVPGAKIMNGLWGSSMAMPAPSAGNGTATNGTMPMPMPSESASASAGASASASASANASTNATAPTSSPTGGASMIGMPIESPVPAGSSPPAGAGVDSKPPAKKGASGSGNDSGAAAGSANDTPPSSGIGSGGAGAKPPTSTGQTKKGRVHGGQHHHKFTHKGIHHGHHHHKKQHKHHKKPSKHTKKTTCESA